MTAYHLTTYLVPREHEETFAADLWSHGLLGCEIHEGRAGLGAVRLDAYLPDPLPEAFKAWGLGEWRTKGVRALSEQALEERDWLAEYRAAARPIEVGRRFLVDPRDEAGASPPEAAEGRMLLRIPARTAFGTGSHESTRLAVEWLEELEPAGLDVLDVGSGSGILCFAALRLGARLAVGFDFDTASVLMSRQYGEANALRPVFYAGRLAALRERPAFDLALVNVLPERILDEIPSLLPLLRAGARVISSGNLRSRRDELLGRFAFLGLTSVGEKRAGEWVAFCLR